LLSKRGNDQPPGPPLEVTAEPANGRSAHAPQLPIPNSHKVALSCNKYGPFLTVSPLPNARRYIPGLPPPRISVMYLHGYFPYIADHA